MSEVISQSAPQTPVKKPMHPKKKKALRTCTIAESEKIAEIAEEIYNNVGDI
jgi:hypothetical protein